MSWTAAEEAVTAAGGVLRRGVSRRISLAVVGHRAHALLDEGRLAGRIAAAERAGARVTSENALFRALGLADALPAIERDLAPATVATQAKLDDRIVRLLTLFDLVQPDADGRFGFRDLVAARQVARPLSKGTSLADVIAATLSVRADSDSGDLTDRLARVHLDADADGVVLRLGTGTAELDGQMRLALPDVGNPPVDELMEIALAAEEDGEFAEAEALYRRCADADRCDPTAAYNLGNVLREQKQPREARVQFERALSMDKNFVEARYNLAHVLERAGDLAGARHELETALATDAADADAHFNLAGLKYRTRDLAGAIASWERYLELDARGEWADRARQSLALCRMELRA